MPHRAILGMAVKTEVGWLWRVNWGCQLGENGARTP